MLPITSTSKSSKVKIFKKLIPGKNVESIIEFVDSNDQFGRYVEQIHNQNLEKSRVISLAGPLIKFKLGDAYRIIVAHNERHILQAQEVLIAIK